MVVVTDLKMPFGSMVSFMIKWAIAAIPAAIILSMILGFLLLILSNLFWWVYEDVLDSNKAGFQHFVAPLKRGSVGYYSVPLADSMKICNPTFSLV